MKDKSNFSDSFFQLEILDACVEYIESLQDQLDLHCQKSDGSKIPRKSLLVTARSNFFVKRDENLRHNIRMRWMVPIHYLLLHFFHLNQ